ncbi:MAG: tetratricopeptide repeat protein [Spirochaetales bacterium]|nr:tetratricopeptide repeat protein [Spirochaetales bacterium]
MKQNCRSGCRLHLVLIAGAFFLGSCSSLPRGDLSINTTKNEAADYLTLADNFLSQGDFNSALFFYNEALITNLSVDHQEGAIVARSSLGKVYLRLQSWDDAQRELEDALFDARMLKNPRLLALTLNNLGEYYFERENYPLAQSSLFESLTFSEDDEKIRAVILHNLGVDSLRTQAFDEARDYFEKARYLNERGKRWGEYGSNSYMLANLAFKEGQLQTAIEFALQALEADKKAENRQGIGDDLLALGQLYRRAEDLPVSYDYFRRAFHAGVQINSVQLTLNALNQLVELSELLGYTELKTRYEDLRSRLNP